MANLNKVLLMGNLTRDPEMRWSSTGTGICKAGLAVNRTWKSADGVRQEDTTFVDLVMFGRSAETFHQYMRKGRPVFIEGRLSFSSWEASDGQKRSKLEVVAERFQFMGGRPDDAEPKAEAAAISGPPAPARAVKNQRYGEHPELDGRDIPF